MTRQLFTILVALIYLAGCAHPLTDTQTAKVRSSQADPGNTTYLIEGREVQLVDGRDVTEIVPGAASKTVTQVFSQPVYGDVDGKGEADAALILVQTGGGSGTFYYAAAVLNAGSAWQGTNTVLLGDRIDPHDITIRKSLIIVTYNDRRLDEPMISTPTVEVTKYLSVEDGKLKEIAVGDGGSVVVEGWVIMGHEVHSFQPCQEDSDLWLLGISPALSEIMVEYRQAAADSPPYRPILMVLGGINAPRPRHGFGADYEAAFLATELIKIAPEEHCPNALIRIDSPAPGAQISFPLTVTGQARGNWFFEGDFPLLLTDSMGRTLAEDYASAQGPWMTEEFVPFTGTLKSPERSFNSWGWLILKKDNPSERRELDDAVKIPLFFK